MIESFDGDDLDSATETDNDNNLQQESQKRMKKPPGRMRSSLRIAVARATIIFCEFLSFEISRKICETIQQGFLKTMRL